MTNQLLITFKSLNDPYPYLRGLVSEVEGNIDLWVMINPQENLV